MVTAAKQSSYATTAPTAVMKQTSSPYTTSYHPLVRHISKHNILIISFQVGRGKNNRSCLHNSPKRDEEYLIDFSSKSKQVGLNIKFQKTEIFEPTPNQNYVDAN